MLPKFTYTPVLDGRRASQAARTQATYAKGAQEAVQHLDGSEMLGWLVAVQVHVELDVREVRRQLMREVHGESGLTDPGSPRDRGDDDGATGPLGDDGTKPAELRLPTSEVGDIQRELVR